MGRCQPPNEEVVVKVDFPFPLDKATFTKLVLDIAKNLLLQKSQIPLQYEAIAKEVELDAIHTAESEDDSDKEGEEYPSKLSVREKMKQTRARKNKAQLVKHGRKLVDDMKNLENVIDGELAYDGVNSINFVFGATAHTGREIYSVEVPDGIHPFPDYSSSSRTGLHLYRAMLANNALQDRLNSRIPVSNIFTVISKRNLIPSPCSDLLHLPEYLLPVTTRCSRVLFQFSSPPPPSLAAARRLRFASGNDPPGPGHGHCGSGGSGGRSLHTDQGTPCTQAQLRPRVGAEDMELCTPAIRWKTPHTELLQSPMTMCTPALTQHSWDTLCTPSVQVQPSSMEMCTPLGSNKHSLDMGSPTLSRMELRTPASNKVVSSMEMCTPQVQLPDWVTEDSLDVKTLEISNLTLESQNKKTKLIHNDEDLKDSGISSPETQDDSRTIHWFTIEHPIRGFKYKPY